MKNANHTSHFCRLLSRQGLLKENPLQVVDVGARGGPQSHWGVYSEDVNIVGFEPHPEESEKLNRDAAAGKFQGPFKCFPIALGKANGTARLYQHPSNEAADSLIPHKGKQTPYRDIEVRRFDDFAVEHGITSIDFMKIDVERRELEVLQGLGKFLSNSEILGFEIEVHFYPRGYVEEDTPLFSDIDMLLRPHGYSLYDLDLFRGSSKRLPMPVAWDHRDHNNKPVLGPTISGRLLHGDALFFRDINSERDSILRMGNVTRILKMASLLEVYGLPDCAVDLLVEYRAIIDPLVPVDALLNAFVPPFYGEGLSYKEYLQIYHRNVGRVPPPAAVTTGSMPSGKWRLFRKKQA